MCLAKTEDVGHKPTLGVISELTSGQVDMVLLAGDLFHENKPSRKAMYQVMRSLRMNCYGDKPCELEMLSDASEIFQGHEDTFPYELPTTSKTDMEVAPSTTSITKTRISMLPYPFSPFMAITMTLQQSVSVGCQMMLRTTYMLPGRPPCRS